MDEWLYDVVSRLTEVAKADVYYQELQNQCQVAEEEYIKIVKGLSDEERLKIDDYIALCEDIQFRMTQLAYNLGVVDGSMRAMSP